MGIVIVEICQANYMNGMNLEEILEREYPEVAVLVNDCLSFCGMCAAKPYAIVNGKRLFANTVEECLVKIKEQIEKELSIYE